MIVGIATDHGGYALKEELVGRIRAKGHEVVDFGAHLIHDHMRHNKAAKALATYGLLLPLSGCGMRGAPSFILFGAYFPGWMLCALVGILGAIGARTVMVASRLSDDPPFQLFVCVSAGLIVTTVAWLLWFGR